MAGWTKRTWTAAFAAAAVIAVVAVAATSVLGAGDDAPRWGKLTIDLSKDAQGKRAPNHGGGGGGNAGGGGPSQTHTTQPKVVYLKSGATVIDPVAIGTSYLDIKLKGCQKVIEGGIATQDQDIFVQGSDVEPPGVYHVRIGFDDSAASTPHPFTITSHLTCLKGVK
jgi:hypothetical protein